MLKRYSPTVLHCFIYMRILIDTSPLLIRSAGVKNYLYYWFAHLERHRKNNQISAFPLMDSSSGLHHEGSVLKPIQSIPRIAFVHWVNMRGNPTLRWLNRKVEVFHTTNQIRNPVTRAKLTATLYDMTCWLTPELHTPMNVANEKRFAASLKQANGLIAISEHTRRDAIRILDLNPAKVVRIYPGVSEAFFDVSMQQARRTAQRYQLEKPFILAVGTIEPRKNLDTLLDSYQKLSADLRETYDLVFIGPLGWASSRTVRRIRSNPDAVKYLGYVPEVDLPALTKAATVLVYPSLYEGFGLPVAQAMACGVPIITSATSCLPEISGDGALHVDPKSSSELATALARILESPELRESLGGHGRVIAEQRYRWDQCAIQSWEFFERVAG